jgi:hypothetical protein
LNTFFNNLKNKTKKESSNQIANEKQTSLPQFDNYYNYDNRDKRLSNLQPGSQNHLNWPSTHTELTNAELRTKLLHMGKSKRGLDVNFNSLILII